MKTRVILLLVLCTPLLLSACGKKKTSAIDPASSIASSPNPAAPLSEVAGPADLPLCDGIVSVEKSSGDAQSGSSVLISNQTIDRLLDAYVSDLSAAGWILKTSIPQGREHHLLFRQGERFLRIQIGPSPLPTGKSRLLLAWGKTAGAPAVLEAYEPDLEADSDQSQGSMEW